jgi:hypothetical protein
MQHGPSSSSSLRTFRGEDLRIEEPQPRLSSSIAQPTRASMRRALNGILASTLVLLMMGACSDGSRRSSAMPHSFPKLTTWPYPGFSISPLPTTSILDDQCPVRKPDWTDFLTELAKRPLKLDAIGYMLCARAIALQALIVETDEGPAALLVPYDVPIPIVARYPPMPCEFPRPSPTSPSETSLLWQGPPASLNAAFECITGRSLSESSP